MHLWSTDGSDLWKQIPDLENSERSITVVQCITECIGHWSYVFCSKTYVRNNFYVVCFRCHILWGVTYTIMDIPFWSMIPRLHKPEKETETISGLGYFVQELGLRFQRHWQWYWYQFLVVENEREGFRLFGSHCCGGIYSDNAISVYQVSKKRKKVIEKVLVLKKCSKH